MPNYRRPFRPGGTFFLTLVTHYRARIFADPSARALLRQTIQACRQTRPFSLDAIVLLHDHLHLILTLPPDDADFSTRIAFIKSTFTRAYLADGGRERPGTDGRRKEAYRGVWQRRFWEHLIRDQDDLNGHLDYIHYNPVKHGLARCPHQWPHSSFERQVKEGHYEAGWCCSCDGREVKLPAFPRIAGME